MQLHALGLGFDFYFSDYIACDYREASNFTRIGSLRPEEHDFLDAGRGFTAFDQRQSIMSCDRVMSSRRRRWYTGSGDFPSCDFVKSSTMARTFFFWMDIGELGARMVFSMQGRM